MSTTTIQVQNSTVNRLKFHKSYSKESYDELINKLIDEVEEGELSAEAIESIQVGLSEVASRKGESIEDVASEFGVEL